jgi:hypothetical protein
MNLLSAVFCSDSADSTNESEETTGNKKTKNGPYFLGNDPCINQESGEQSMKNKSFHSLHIPIKSISVKLASLFLVAGLVAAAPVVAETPDGTTPANEGACDGLKTNATPALYGLCVAYCEAQDLDITDKDPPNTKILQNYRNRMQPGDPDMPCVKVPCPCWTDAELASISSDGAAAACLKTATSVQLIDNALKPHYALADTARSRCAYVDLNLASPKVNFQTITAEQASACISAVSAACSNLGL